MNELVVKEMRICNNWIHSNAVDFLLSASKLQEEVVLNGEMKTLLLIPLRLLLLGNAVPVFLTCDL